MDTTAPTPEEFVEAGRVGRRGSDRWTHEVIGPADERAVAASADAALIDGHWNPAYRPHKLLAASADAALIDGHSHGVCRIIWPALAASADAALIDGHTGPAKKRAAPATPRRPTRL